MFRSRLPLVFMVPTLTLALAACGQQVPTAPKAAAPLDQPGQAAPTSPHLVRGWSQQLGTPQEDMFFDVATDKVGNTYAVGSTSGYLDTRPGEQTANKGGSDGWIAKYDPSGKLLWVRQCGSEKSDSFAKVAVDEEGNAYVVGLTNGTLSRDNEGGGSTGEQLVIAKYTSEGQKVWIKQAGSAPRDLGVREPAIALTSDGHLAVLLFDGSGDKTVLTWYDKDGHKLFSQPYSGSHFASGLSILAADRQGNVYSFSLRPELLNEQDPETSQVVFTVNKFSAAGQKLFSKSFDRDVLPFSNVSYRGFIGADTDDQGNVYVVSYVDDDPSILAKSSNYLTKLGPDGERIWVQKLKDTRNSRHGPDLVYRDLTVGGNGDLFLAAERESDKTKLDGSPTDVLVARHDAQTGAELEELSFGTPASEQTQAISAAPDGTLYVAGFTTPFVYPPLDAFLTQVKLTN